MTSTKVHINFEDIHRKLTIKRFENERTYLKDNPTESLDKTFNETPETRSTKIKSILENLNKNIHKHGINEMFDAIDKSLYKKSWNKLLPFHKNIKIKEYITEHYGEGTFQTKIINELIALIELKEINLKKHVDYDPKTEKILKINVLAIDLDKKEYKINYNAK